MLQSCCPGTSAVPIETCGDGFSCVDRGGDALPQCVGSVAGAGATTYVGCTFSGGINRIVVAKRDTGRDLCFGVILNNPGTAPSGLTVPSTWGLEASLVTSASKCPSRDVLMAIPVKKTVGTIEFVTLGGAVSANPTRANIDAAVAFVPSSGGVSAGERLAASNVDISPACP
jgi:hypothetical protein